MRMMNLPHSLSLWALLALVGLACLSCKQGSSKRGFAGALPSASSTQTSGGGTTSSSGSSATTATGWTGAPPIRWIPADPSNYSARASRTIDLIIIHTIEGSEAGCISWFQNPSANVSAHYVVSHAGRITQMLQDKDIGWHAGNWSYNERSLGIENEGYAGRNDWTQTQYEHLAWLTSHLCDTHGIPKDRQHIIGHHEVPNQTHWDPGPSFDWAKFMDLVQNGP